MRHFLSLLTILLCLGASAQRAFTVSGYVKDAASGEALIGANVFVKETMRGSATNLHPGHELYRLRGLDTDH
jgi:hypothetical protein